MKQRSENKSWYLKGMRDGIPIALGYFAVAFTLGIAARKAGMNFWQAGAMSALMHASAGQFAVITMIATNGGYLQTAVTTLIVNLRYLLMSCALAQKIEPGTKMGHRFLLSYYITDEIFGISVSVENRLNPFYNYGAATLAGPGWTLGTVCGALVGAILPGSIVNALSVALYGMFLAVIIPPAKKDKRIAVIVILSMLISYLFSILPYLKEISSGMRIIILTILIAGIAAAVHHPLEESGKDICGKEAADES